MPPTPGRARSITGEQMRALTDPLERLERRQRRSRRLLLFWTGLIVLGALAAGWLAPR